jgi:hypothetical protein
MKAYEIWSNDIFRKIPKQSEKSLSQFHFVVCITHPTLIALRANTDMRGEQPDAIRDRLTQVYGLTRYIACISDNEFSEDVH